jgi:hypothetical protein
MCLLQISTGWACANDAPSVFEWLVKRGECQLIEVKFYVSRRALSLISERSRQGSRAQQTTRLDLERPVAGCW